MEEVHYLNDEMRRNLFKYYENNKKLIDSKEDFESWRKLKYDKRCYPFRRLVGELLDKNKN